MNILLIDEDTTFADVYATALTKAGFHVHTARDVREALVKLDREEIHIIITEVLLPGRNGIKLIQDIRMREDTIDVPVYILTTLEAANVGLVDSLAEVLGVKGYFTKQHTTPDALVKHLEASSTAR